MSDTSSLSDLARFVGGAQVEAGETDAPRRAVNAPNSGAQARRERRRVGELLAVVLALSARTRRLVLPKVAIDLDVFSPDGRRAVRLILPTPDRLDLD
jgi:hypothetical protein